MILLNPSESSTQKRLQLCLRHAANGPRLHRKKFVALLSSIKSEAFKIRRTHTNTSFPDSLYPNTTYRSYRGLSDLDPIDCGSAKMCQDGNGSSHRQVSVHVGLANNDWIQMQSWDFKKISPYTATGPESGQGQGLGSAGGEVSKLFVGCWCDQW